MVFFFFNDTATTEIYTLSLHDALPISAPFVLGLFPRVRLPSVVLEIVAGIVIGPSLLGIVEIDQSIEGGALIGLAFVDRKSTRLNSSHANKSYAVFCFKKKK